MTLPIAPQVQPAPQAEPCALRPCDKSSSGSDKKFADFLAEGDCEPVRSKTDHPGTHPGGHRVHAPKNHAPWNHPAPGADDGDQQAPPAADDAGAGTPLPIPGTDAPPPFVPVPPLDPTIVIDAPASTPPAAAGPAPTPHGAGAPAPVAPPFAAPVEPPFEPPSVLVASAPAPAPTPAATPAPAAPVSSNPAPVATTPPPLVNPAPARAAAPPLAHLPAAAEKTLARSEAPAAPEATPAPIAETNEPHPVVPQPTARAHGATALEIASTAAAPAAEAAAEAFAGPEPAAAPVRAARRPAGVEKGRIASSAPSTTAEAVAKPTAEASEADAAEPARKPVAPTTRAAAPAANPADAGAPIAPSPTAQDRPALVADAVSNAKPSAETGAPAVPDAAILQPSIERPKAVAADASPAPTVHAAVPEREPQAVPADAGGGEIKRLLTPQAFERVLEQLRGEIHRGRDEFRLVLEPADMGRLDVNIAARGDGVVLRITAEKADVAHWIRTDLPILHKAIEKDGLHVLGVEVRTWLDQQPHARHDQHERHEPAAFAGLDRFAAPSAKRAATQAPRARLAGATTTLDLIV